MAKAKAVSFDGVNAQGLSVTKRGLKLINFICKIKQFPVVASSDFQRVYFSVGTITITGLLVCYF